MKLIFDVGAHKGEDTEFYLKKGFRVVAVEANPVLAAGLREKFFASIRDGQLILVEAAIAEKEGEISFFQNEASSVWGTIHEDWAKRNEMMGAHSKRIVVQAHTFTTLLERYGIPHYLKVDIEGADMLCIRALKQQSVRPNYVSIESTKTSWKDLVAEFDVLTALGYTRFQVINQTTVMSQREPQPAHEGVCTDHRFPEGSTGLFGADLPGPWITRRRALLIYAHVFLQYIFFGDNTIGGKFAKKLPYRLQKYLIPGWYDTHAAYFRERVS